MKCLSRHQRFCDYFVTDSQELVKMISTPDDWPAFATELTSLKLFGRPTKTEKWFINQDPVTIKRTSLQDKLEQGIMFSHMLTRRCHTG